MTFSQSHQTTCYANRPHKQVLMTFSQDDGIYLYINKNFVCLFYCYGLISKFSHEKQHKKCLRRRAPAIGIVHSRVDLQSRFKYRFCTFFEVLNVFFYSFHLGRAKQKRVFGHMRTANAKISLRIRIVWSGPSLPTNRIIGYLRMFQ